MRLSIIALSTVALFTTTAAVAAPARTTDVEYLRASRCAGLASAGGLEASDAAALRAYVRAQELSRGPAILARGQSEADKARRQISRGGDAAARLQAELSGPCMSVVAAARGADQAASGRD